MYFVPHEFLFLSGILLSPLPVAGLFGLVATVVTVQALNRYRLSRFLAAPSVAALALMVIYTVLISIFIIPA